MARAAVGDGLRHRDLEEIAALGGGGTSAGNELRDYRRLLHRKYGQGWLQTVRLDFVLLRLQFKLAVHMSWLPAHDDPCRESDIGRRSK